ncbi:class I SAM-dependent methyltransferase [Gillisia hiemivivida]|uniref:Class I SAM-dependent methyltransferase n=1 Tax=Gillisia hiemivivida TaxID=291190 RepID=A0A5C6ZTY9_9FLAO|nr:methyltransferase domain-containing protein [Gillisia hiemivivida]TXD93891.1 class I SAM-dependent methyltransferase [Gillisia hiemivivida]
MDLRELPKNNENRHPWEMARAEVAKSLVDHHCSNYEDKNILDLGCGDLFFLTKFSKDKTSAKFYAIDTAFTDEYLETNKGSSIKLYKSLDKLPKDEELVFDLVFIMDVVEHIEDDHGFINTLRESAFISPETIIFITVPAFQNLFCSHDKFLGHFRRYTNKSLENLISKSGFDKIQVGYFFFSLLLPRYIEVIKERNLGNKIYKEGTGLTRWTTNNFITQYIARLLYFDFMIFNLFNSIGIKFPGLSNYIVCRKSV